MAVFTSVYGSQNLEALAMPIPDPHPALSGGGFAQQLKIEHRIDEFISIKIQ
jgi:hypothetical protein